MIPESILYLIISQDGFRFHPSFQAHLISTFSAMSSRSWSHFTIILPPALEIGILKRSLMNPSKKCSTTETTLTSIVQEEWGIQIGTTDLTKLGRVWICGRRCWLRLRPAEIIKKTYSVLNLVLPLQLQKSQKYSAVFWSHFSTIVGPIWFKWTTYQQP